MASNQEKPSKYKKQFEQKYNELVQSISATHFEDYDKLSKENALKIFQTGLRNNILSQFSAVWDYTDTEEHLQVLDVLKADPRNDSEKKWRPTDKSVQEQVRPLVVNKLKWQIKYYEKQIQFQKQQLERAVLKIEQGRTKYADLLERRESLKNAVSNELKDLKKIDAQISDMADKLVDDLQS
uniref:(northern house mosquito) hypothetical protein n=1 Tax=Culex pipiens TaxID=7175 RepID=A0A8D8JQ99_CULPI